MLFENAWDTAKVLAVASGNVAGGVAAEIARHHENYVLHDGLTIVQMIVGVLSIVYIGVKVRNLIFRAPKQHYFYQQERPNPLADPDPDI